MTNNHEGKNEMTKELTDATKAVRVNQALRKTIEIEEGLGNAVAVSALTEALRLPVSSKATMFDILKGA